ncbi:hypothetical protein HO133_005149 [Letharia lupina]|uniref:Grh/CP2 DB domain-containing protein n=1 Tax=Letharia lupina TaxID=560253 RepID=A0A8H6C9V7_9LECA|nr:uncharacterized protein HO133_005149 [Letharia lupina]KAF6219324.1 hypothetical protein HO133_005149 [Letharia lupina]
MFRNRKNSQKPANELYAAFKQSFPHVGPATTTPSWAVSSNSTLETSTSLTSTSMDQTMDQRQFGDQDTSKDQDSGFGEPDDWRFTPSILDTNSFAFASFANHQSSDFGSTPGGTNTVFHNNQAGDLHTPGQSDATAAIDMHGFHTHLLHSQPFQNPSRFTPQQSYAPSSFIHQDSGYDTMEHPNHAMPAQRSGIDEELPRESTFMGFPARQSDSVQAHPVPAMESFRYLVTLNAPTAMIKDSDEIPVTYLNKGQAYAVSISDSMGLGPAAGPIKYRTVIRISFEDEQQRQRPSACWQLWKEGRGLAESHLRGGKLQAVEYVDPNQGGDEETKRPRVELEAASFDCFSVTWTPSAGSSSADCSVAVRFNFLSTDFSHSKGVKGIPVRLCAKTEIISSGTPDSPPAPTAEVCFCKVKLFRDHGAERKLSNDVAHIKKTIDKLNQQITQAENGLKDLGKRKRSGADKGGSHRAGKVQKHKRTWSVSSQGSNGRPPVEEDLHMKLATMQDMFTSTRPVSVLYLKGYEQDDPDVFPVSLPGEPIDLTKVGQSDRKALSESTPTNSYIASPSPSSRSMPSDSRPCEPSSFQKPAPFNSNQHLPNEWEQQLVRHQFTSTNFSGFPSSNTAIKVPKGHTDESMSNWIEAFEVDPSYKAPAEKPIKPIACFYVLIKVIGDTAGEDYYRAVYLMERTVKDLITSIAMKCGVDPRHVTRTLRVNSRGLKIMVDDEVVGELPEGQDMIVEFAQVNASTAFKQEAGSGASTPKATQTPTKSTSSAALEMRLLF